MRLYSTLSGRTEPFAPSGDVVTMYVCGLTPYAPSHVGHAMRAVVFDVLRRYLEYRGHEVRHVENFTDIDDKMIDGAAREGVTTGELAERNIELYLQEMDALNVLRAHVYPRATREIPGMIEMIDGLVDKGYAYAVDGDVYFSVRRDEEYGRLSRRDLDAMLAGARVEADDKKADQMDFALWKSMKPGEPSWDSPWGPGRPGWHIECSAMALHYLGETVDIHGGGQDLVFPHHENEIAQTENYTGVRPMARFWMHNGWMKLGDDKMSKSTGNFVTLGDALERFSSDALRLFFLASHYRRPLSYTDDAMLTQERAAERLRNAAQLEGDEDGSSLDAQPYRQRFEAAMDDDLNTPRALAVLFDMAREMNRAREQGHSLASARQAYRELATVLGLTLEERAKGGGDEMLRVFAMLPGIHTRLKDEGVDDLADRLQADMAGHGVAISSQEAPALADGSEPGAVGAAALDLLVEIRQTLRSSRRYDLADYLRDTLSDAGFVLEDTPTGTEWKTSTPNPP